MKCAFPNFASGTRCAVCGYELKRDYPTGYNRDCGIHAPPKVGDRVERMLAVVGITPDRYARAKELFGLPPTCGCKERREWLNKVSDWWRGEAS